MLHANPLLRDISCDKKFITVGEIMLRLTPPNYEFGHRQHVLLGCAE